MTPVVCRKRVPWKTVAMQRISLEALARQQLESATRAGGGHTADTVYGGREKVLRQTVVAMIAGSSLAEHENPGEATLQVLSGRVRLSSGDLSWEARTGDMIFVPDARHSVEALVDSTFLLTVAKVGGRVQEPEAGPPPDEHII
jgi:quercetin dioxygenase-like cupin family protein